MKFYTNVFIRGNNIFVRGYDNGKPVENIIPYRPYLFIEDKNGDYKTINDKTASKIQFGDVSEAKKFIEKYKNVDNFNIYGLDNFTYTYSKG